MGFKYSQHIKKLIMKFLFMAFLCPLFVCGQITTSFPGPPPDSADVITYFRSGLYTNSGIECEYWEKYSNWKVENKGDDGLCFHSWANAKYEDINPTTPFTNAVYCPCACGGTIQQARICRTCKRHEKRTKTHGYDQVYKKSEYKILLDSLKKN